MSNIRTITLTEAATINANGKERTKGAKPVFCITTGEVYASATDAAEANGVSIYAISTCCLGKVKTSNKKRFCYVKDIHKHLQEISTNMQVRENKVKAYDKMMYHQQAIDEAAAKIEKHKANCSKLEQKLEAERQAVLDAERELEDLTKEG